MPRTSMIVPTGETRLLWRFFDSVSSAIAGRMDRGSPPGEENLTFLLCELLDEASSDLHRLEVSLAQVKQELENSDSGLSVEIAFETHPHSKHHEAKYSGADLGLVVVLQHPLLGTSTRALLLQAKKLFPQSKSSAFSVHSGYTSFDSDQAKFLQALAQRFGVWRSIFYLWYNPSCRAFEDAHAKHIRAYEAMPMAFHSWHGHPFMDELLEFGYPFVNGSHFSAFEGDSASDEAASKWRSLQPAVRLSSLDTVISVTGTERYPRLRALYEASARSRDFASFTPFADFMLLALLNPRVGSDNDQWIRLARGEAVQLPDAKPNNQNNAANILGNLESAPTPRHTLQVTVKSTLPPIG